MALTIIGFVVFIFFLSQSALAFVAGDKVKLSMNPKLGPFTVEKCYLENSEQVCKLKEAGYFVNSTYLIKNDPSVKLAKEVPATEASAVRVQVIGR